MHTLNFILYTALKKCVTYTIHGILCKQNLCMYIIYICVKHFFYYFVQGPQIPVVLWHHHMCHEGWRPHQVCLNTIMSHTPGIACWSFILMFCLHNIKPNVIPQKVHVSPKITLTNTHCTRLRTQQNCRWVLVGCKSLGVVFNPYNCLYTVPLKTVAFIALWNQCN